MVIGTSGRYFLGVLYGENRPKSENWAILTPRIAPQPYVVQKSYPDLGPYTADKSPPHLLNISNNPVQRVTCFKLLGINLCNDLRWDAHVDVLCSEL